MTSAPVVTALNVQMTYGQHSDMFVKHMADPSAMSGLLVMYV